MSLGEGAFRRKYLTGVSVLKQMPVTLMPAVVPHCMAGQQPSHHCSYRGIAGSQKQVKMFGIKAQA